MFKSLYVFNKLSVKIYYRHSKQNYSQPISDSGTDEVFVWISHVQVNIRDKNKWC